jgi:uncharacterized protein (TIGR02611 family)
MARLPTGRGAGRFARRVVVTTIGSVLVCIGVPLLVLPGPGILLVVAGLAVLSTEYLWARSAMGWIKARAQRVKDRVA